MQNGKITITADEIITDGLTKLGGAGANQKVLTTPDTHGDDRQATKVLGL